MHSAYAGLGRMTSLAVWLDVKSCGAVLDVFLCPSVACLSDLQ